MVRIEGYTSKKVIRRWLVNYESMAAGDIPLDAMPRNSGPKAADGWGPGKLNKIMLDQAIENIPDKRMKACVYARWIYQLPLGKTLRTLNIPKSTYYKHCDDAVDFIYREINGERVGVKNLLNTILN